MKCATYRDNENAFRLNKDGTEVKTAFGSESYFIGCDLLDFIDAGIQGLADSDAAITR
jgi:hypothetical protein